MKTNSCNAVIFVFITTIAQNNIKKKKKKTAILFILHGI